MVLLEYIDKLISNIDKNNIPKTIDLILDGGQCLIGIESTIINCSEITPSVLRSGSITNEMIEKICDLDNSTNKDLRLI